MEYKSKIKHAKDLIAQAIDKYPKIAVACSFGKDSMTVVHLARRVNPEIKIFSIMTKYKPKETFSYLVNMNKQMNLGVEVYMVAENVPEILKRNNIKVHLLPIKNFNKLALEIQQKTNQAIYAVNPDLCCELLKVEPTKEAVKNLDAWICGLRNTEGRTREDYQEIEIKNGLVKINPILEFTEQEVLRYLQENQISLHPWYTKRFNDGRKYRSLGCEPCTQPIFDRQLERDGRWQKTSKCGGECGIHTQVLKN